MLQKSCCFANQHLVLELHEERGQVSFCATHFVMSKTTGPCKLYLNEIQIAACTPMSLYPRQ